VTTPRFVFTPRRFNLALFALGLAGLFVRLGGRPTGTLFRDDAWVALSSRVPLHTAVHMLGTAPLYSLFVRWWVGVVGLSHTALLTLPTLIDAAIAPILVTVVAAWWGLRRDYALLAGFFIVISRSDIMYATHLKPYAHDLIAGILVLAAGEFARRGRSAWPLVALAVATFATSFTIAPVIAGSLVALVRARRRDWRQLSLPIGLIGAACVSIYWAARGDVTARLHHSWAGYYVDWSGPGALFHSLNRIGQGVLWGFTDTTPHLHVPGLGSLIEILVAMLIITGLITSRQLSAARWSLIFALAASTLALAPLGTGRTDAYLHPALALLAAAGAKWWITQLARYGRYAAIGGLAVFCTLSLGDRVLYHFTYPGGDLRPVAAAAQQLQRAGGTVLIEGTARWPWALYEASNLRIGFSADYNTGFYPVISDPQVVVMRGSKIEGNYSPTRIVSHLHHAPTVLYVRADDWPQMGNPLADALRHDGYHVTRAWHVPGYLLETLTR